MTEDALAQLAGIDLRVSKGPYALGSWKTESASEILAKLATLELDMALAVVDEKEVSCLVPQKILPELPPPVMLEEDWAIVTLDQEMDWGMVGVLAAVSTALARAKIPLGAFSAYSRDHLLVKQDQLDPSMKVLKEICGETRFED